MVIQPHCFCFLFSQTPSPVVSKKIHIEKASLYPRAQNNLEDPEGRNQDKTNTAKSPENDLDNA